MAGTAGVTSRLIAAGHVPDAAHPAGVHPPAAHPAGVHPPGAHPPGRAGGRRPPRHRTGRAA